MQGKLVERELNSLNRKSLFITRPQQKTEEKNKSVGLEEIQIMINKLNNEVIETKRNFGEGPSTQIPYKPYIIIPNHLVKAIELAPANFNFDLSQVSMEFFFSYHQENHSKKTCPKW